MTVKWGIINSRARPVHQSKTYDFNCDNIQEWKNHFSIQETLNPVWRISALIPHTNKTRATLLNDEVTSIICLEDYKLWYILHVPGANKLFKNFQLISIEWTNNFFDCSSLIQCYPDIPFPQFTVPHSFLPKCTVNRGITVLHNTQWDTLSSESSPNILAYNKKFTMFL